MNQPQVPVYSISKEPINVVRQIGSLYLLSKWSVIEEIKHQQESRDDKERIHGHKSIQKSPHQDTTIGHHLLEFGNTSISEPGINIRVQDYDPETSDGSKEDK